MRKIILTSIAAASFSLLSPSADAQQLVGLDGVTGEVIVFNGNTSGACPVLSGPVTQTLPTQVAGGVCTAPVPVGAPGTTDVGAIATMLRTGRYRYALDPNIIDLNNYGGMFVDGTFEGASDMAIWGLGSITGAAYRYTASSDTESVYLTAGQSILKFSPAVACTGTPGFTFGEAWPFFSGPGILTGLDYVEADGTMWACTSMGEVLQMTASGTVATSFPATILQPHLTGIAVDSATGSIFVTDGVSIMQYDATGAPAAGEIWWPNVFEFAPGGLVGLDWVPAGASYGAGGDVGTGLAVPTLSASGYSVIGNPLFSLDVQGNPLHTYLYFWSPAELCPPLTLFGTLPVHIAPPYTALGAAVADGTGLAVKPTPMPASPAFVSARLHVQAVGLFGALGVIESTNAVTFVISTH